ncbi:MAG: GreA/GreB family elongation factor [Chloroflexi bacterium]|nr:GreA/GreB family elongation factor [Chloroflexota bacterium]
MVIDVKNLSLGEGAGQYLAGLKAEERARSQQEINSFVRWYSWGRSFAALTAPEIANYAEQLSLSDTDYASKLELVKAFLAYARKAGWSRTNLGIHLKAKKAKSAPNGRCGLPEVVALTARGYAELEAELAGLKNKRSQVIEDITKAAADKDFRENAPLAAAREQKSFLEGRIKELEETLKLATILNSESRVAVRINIGDRVYLENQSTGQEVNYVIVHPTEVDPANGRISSASPIGKSVLGRCQSEIIEVIAPAGKMCYRVSRVER